MPRYPRSLMRLNTTFDKEQLATALSTSPDPRLQAVAIAIRNPENAAIDERNRMSIAAICVQERVSYDLVAEHYKRWARTEGDLQAAKRYPAMVQRLARQAAPSRVACIECNGEGRITAGKGKRQVTELCKACSGAGQVEPPGDPLAQKRILEIMGVLGQQKVNIVNAQGSQFLTTNDRYEDLLKAARAGGQGQAGAPAMPAMPVLEAEVTDGPD